MDNALAVAQVIAPIFVAIFLGALARRKNLLTPENVQGMQQFVVQFGLPCVVFNSCLTASIGAQALSTMALVLPASILSTALAFWLRRKTFRYHNLPMLFAAQESGMMGIPLYMVLFGTAQAYRMGVLDLTQAITAYPVIALLGAAQGESLSPVEIVKKIFTSPLLIMCLSGLALNLTGAAAWMDSIGVGPVITACTSFIGQPISAMMIFAVGYNFSLEKGSRSTILKISAIHFGLYAAVCLLIQGALCLMPGVDALTRWAILLYCSLPSSYLAPGLGRNEEEYTVASGVCSVLTIVCIAVFCVIAVAVA